MELSFPEIWSPAKYSLGEAMRTEADGGQREYVQQRRNHVGGSKQSQVLDRQGCFAHKNS
jgi:hypothetical protein